MKIYISPVTYYESKETQTMIRNILFPYQTVKSLNGYPLLQSSYATKGRVTTGKDYLLSYSLYLLDKNYTCINTNNEPLYPNWMSDTSQNPKKINYGLCSISQKTDKAVYAYICGKKLSAAELASFSANSEPQKTLFPFSEHSSEISIDSYTVWKCYAQNVFYESSKASEFLSATSKLFSNQEEVSWAGQNLRNCRYIVLPGDTPVDMFGIISGLNLFCESGFVLRTHIQSILKDVLVAHTSSLNGYLSVEASWNTIIKTRYNPLTVLGLLYAHAMVNLFGLKQDTVKSMSVDELLATIEKFINLGKRDEEVTRIFDKTFSDEVLNINFGEYSARNILPLHMSYINGIRNAFPQLTSDIDSYYDLNTSTVKKVEESTNKEYIFSTVDHNADYTVFTITFYNPDGSIKNVLDSLSIDLTGIDFLTYDGVQQYCKIIFDILIKVSVKAKMGAMQSFRFVSETARYFFKDKVFPDNKHVRYAFAAVMFNLASNFDLGKNPERGVQYKHDPALSYIHPKKCNENALGIDCVYFTVLGLYILGIADYNINDSEIGVDDIIKKIDPDGIPLSFESDTDKLYTVMFNANEYLCVEKSPAQEFMESLVRKYTVKGKSREEAIGELIKEKLVTDKRLIEYAPNDERHIYSNGVRNLLANTKGIFDRYEKGTLPPDLAQDMTGVLGILRIKKNPKDQKNIWLTAVSEHPRLPLEKNKPEGFYSFDNDRVDHIFTFVTNDSIAHSRGGHGPIVQSFTGYSEHERTEYYLCLKKPERK